MLERFTEKAVNVVSEAQNLARKFKSSEVLPEHLLLSLVKEAKGVSLKLFRMYNVTYETMSLEVEKNILTNGIEKDSIPFSQEFKVILRRAIALADKSSRTNILFEHLFYVVITSENKNIKNILDVFNFDINNSKDILKKLVQKKIKRMEHPEIEEVDDKVTSIEALYEGDALSDVLDRAVAKLSTSGYEILGTEQILASILETPDSNLVDILEKNGLNTESFENKLKDQNSRQAEFEEKRVVFTPNAFFVMNTAFQIAKELGSSVIKPEHILLSMLKTKKGLAYKIINAIGLSSEKVYRDILKPIEKQMPETLTIMKLAKEEARRIGRNVVGTEMFLLGILAEGTSVAFEVLNELEITMRDARLVVESLVGFGSYNEDKEISFTQRSKNILEKAWGSAKHSNKQKIEAVDLLLAILDEPESLAMKALNQLGVDSVEIRHGILSRARDFNN